MHAINRNAKASSRRDPALDGLRGLAVLMVYVFHYGGGLKSPHFAVRLLGRATEAGWTGVTLFFVLSGFLITGSLWDSRSQPRVFRNFFARRALRILPLYLFAVLLCLLLAVGRGSTFADTHNFFIYFFFLQDLPILVARAQLLYTPLPLYHLWSLAVEEQFYLVWPCLLMMLHSRRAALRLAIGTVLTSFLFVLLVYGVPPIHAALMHSLDLFPLTHAGALGCGAAVAILSRGQFWELAQRSAPAILVSAAVVFLLSGWLAGSYTLTGSLQFSVGLPAASLALAALLVLALQPGPIRSLLAWIPLQRLGGISYGFYVFHILLQPLFDVLAIHLTHATAGSLYQTARFIVGFPITVAVSWLSFHFLEVPFLQWKKRFPMHRPLPPAVTEGPVSRVA